MNRRSFLGMMLAAAAAPAYVRAQSLMKVRAPSSTAATVEMAVADALRYPAGMVEVMSTDGRVLATLAVSGKVRDGGLLHVEPSFVQQAGVYEGAYVTLPGLGRFRIKTSHSGAHLTTDMEVQCADGLTVEMDRAAELVAAGLAPGVIVSAY